jgi:hypothetical protein
MTGLYHVPIGVIASQTGLTKEGASKGLRRLSEGGFCRYDFDREEVFVVEMARFQVGEQLAPNDNRVVGIRRELQAYRNSKHYDHFCQRYGAAFHLSPVPPTKPLSSPSEGASKPLGSQEQEQEQEQEKERERAPATTTRGDVASFETFWSSYPRKKAKAAARKAWDKLAPDAATAAAILAAVEQHKRSEQWVRDGGQFIPHPATWLNGRRWEDELEPARNGDGYSRAEVDAALGPVRYATADVLRECGYPPSPNGDATGGGAAC